MLVPKTSNLYQIESQSESDSVSNEYIVTNLNEELYGNPSSKFTIQAAPGEFRQRSEKWSLSDKIDS